MQVCLLYAITFAPLVPHGNSEAHLLYYSIGLEPVNAFHGPQSWIKACLGCKQKTASLKIVVILMYCCTSGALPAKPVVNAHFQSHSITHGLDGLLVVMLHCDPCFVNMVMSF